MEMGEVENFDENARSYFDSAGDEAIGLFICFIDLVNYLEEGGGGE